MNHFGKEKTPFIFIIDYECRNPLLFKLSDTAEAGVFYRINGLTNSHAGQKPDSPSQKQITMTKPISFEYYQNRFNQLQSHIRAGETYLANLTFPTGIQLGTNLKSIFHSAQAPYCLLFRDDWTVFSPESFVTLSDGLITTRPMKGTRPLAPDAVTQLMADEKEKAEHVTVVDLLRNDLSRVSKNVRVTNFRYAETIPDARSGLVQTSSEISGELPADWQNNLGSILAELLPAGSVTGAPKPRTVDILSRLEDGPRGYYTGVFGVFDGNSLQSAVMIRFIEKTDSGYQYRSGGGIRIDSEAGKEYQEMLEKIYVPIS